MPARAPGRRRQSLRRDGAGKAAKVSEEGSIEVSPDEALEIGISFLRKGKAQAAGQVFDQILEEFPDHADTWHFRGLLFAQKGETETAKDMVRRSLELAPGNAAAWNNLGNLCFQSKDPQGAYRAYQRCLELQPDFPDALTNIGFLLRNVGEFEEAAALYRRALEVRPDYPEALNNLGTLMLVEGRIEESIALLRRAVELEPRFGDAYSNLGEALERTGAAQEAAQCFWKSIVLNQGNKTARKLMVYALIESGQREKAIACAREWLDMAPNDPDAQHHYAAVTGENVPERASDAYVSVVFDRYAATFDKSLASLKYQAPELVAAALAAERGEGRADLDILDAGCGTGLCGPLVAPHARAIDGMDLSRGMLDRAAARGLYRALDQAEITAAMTARPAAYDVVISADTFCYFGDLTALLAACAATLRPGGTLVFSVEALEADHPTPFRINQGNGRYAHTRAHVEAAADAAGLVMRASTRADLRMEGGKPVAGDVHTLARPAA